jgi:hypothetical protein
MTLCVKGPWPHQSPVEDTTGAYCGLGAQRYSGTAVQRYSGTAVNAKPVIMGLASDNPCRIVRQARPSGSIRTEISGSR